MVQFVGGRLATDEVSSATPPGRERVDDPPLVLADLLGREEVGRRAEPDPVAALGDRLDPLADLVERPGGAVGVDHLVGDAAGIAAKSPRRKASPTAAACSPKPCISHSGA